MKRIVLYAIPLGYLVYSFIILLFIKGHSYEDLVQFYSKRWPTGFDAKWMSNYCYTREWDMGLRTHMFFWLGGIAGAGVLYCCFSRAILSFLADLLREVGMVMRFLRSSFFALALREKVGVGVIFGVLFLYWMNFYVHYPLNPDEANSYVFFARRGVFFAAMNYPLPNNHILLSLCAGLLDKLPLVTPRLAMRLPSFAAAFFMYYAIFCLFVHWGGYRRAMVTLIGVGFVHLLVYYGFQGRGYQLQTLFAMVSALGAWAYWFSSRWAGRSGYALFVVASTLGFYCNPQFLNPFFTITLLLACLLWKDRSYAGLLVLGKAAGLVTGLVMILYLPVIICNSWNWLTNNSYLVKESWDFLAHKGLDAFYYVVKFSFFYGYMAVWLFGAAVAFSFYLYFRRIIAGEFYRLAAGYFVAGMVALVVLTLYLRRYPLERGLCYWFLLLNMVFVNVVYDAARHYIRPPAVALGLVVVFLAVKTGWSLRPLYVGQYRWFNDGQVKLYADMQRDFPRLVALHPGSWQVTQSDSYYSMYLRLYLESHRQPEDVVVDGRSGRADIVFLPEDARDTFHLGNYVLWAEKRLKPLDSLNVSILVRPELLR